ncbi:uncharacterized protein M6B38_282440 [Iris pallida]|uniref:Calmodulin-binding domain-containing protein n=1 Tax=Iris pallida TaxID=29817 RepID=A0AAX6I0W1_IRIPA|nr:uncharacterized protein M6B38_282440 [Iris pallida]
MMIEEEMERDITLVTPENTMPSRKMEQNLTTTNVIPDGSLSPLRSDEKVRSRYLRSSVASCHDHCKFGKKHDSEAVSPSLRTFLKKNAIHDREQNQVSTPKGGEKGLRMVTKPKVETEFMPGSDFSDKPDLPKPKTPARTKKSITPSEKKTLLTSRDSKRSRVKSPTPRGEKKTEVIKRRTPPQSQSSPDELNVINLTDLSPASEANAMRDPSSIKENTESTDSRPISSVAPAEITSDLTSHDEKKKVNKRRTPLQSPSSPDKLKVTNLTDLSPASEVDPSGGPVSNKETTELAVSERTSSAASTEIKQKAPSSVKKLQIIKQKAPLPLRRDVSSRSSIVLKTKTPLIRSLSHHKSSRSLIARRTQEKKTTKSLGTILGVFSSKPRNTVKTTKAPLLRSISTRRNQEKITRSSDLSKIGEGAARPANNSKTLPITSASPQIKPSRSLNARGNQERKITRSLDTSNIEERKALVPSPAPSSSKPPRNGVSSLLAGKLRNLMRSSSARKKDKVGVANGKKSEDTDLDRNHKVEDSKSATNKMVDGKFSKGESKSGVRRTSSTGRPQDNITPAYKLKFRQGKVIDLRSDSIGARRLWFRIGKMAGENQNASSLGWRRSFRKKDMGGTDSSHPNSEAQMVILKHQATLKKKDAQALFNHVIEETASKLVETRKSKVKALVGAFETVISLQESKPASVL